ncbi:MAG: hypothetical protein R3E89_11165 [Thiolinea sp.]
MFHSGEAFDPALLAETERLLRNRKYLRRVSADAGDAHWRRR